MAMLFDYHLYISTIISGAVNIYIYIQKPRNSIQHVSTAKVSLLDFSSLHSYHMGVLQIWATRKNGTIDSFVLFYVNRKWKGLATLFGRSRSFTAS